MARHDRQPKSLSLAQRKRKRRDYLRQLQTEHGTRWSSVVALPVYWFHGALVDANGNILKGELNSGAPRPPVLPRKPSLSKPVLRLISHSPRTGGSPSELGRPYTHLPWGSEGRQPERRSDDWFLGFKEP